MGKNPLAALGQARVISGNPHELGRGIALDGERNVSRAAGIDAPTAVFVLVAHHFSERALEPAWFAAFQQRVEKNIVGLELGAPVAVVMLQREQVFAPTHDGRLHIGHVRVNAAKLGPPEMGYRSLRFLLLRIHSE